MSCLRIVATAAVVIAFADIASAGFLEAFSGHSVTVNPDDGGDGIINFAVYETEDLDWRNDFTINGSSFQSLRNGVDNPLGEPDDIDVDAKYVYFYQVVNSDPGGVNESALHTLFVNNPEHFTSHGHANGFVFSDSGGAVGPGTNQKLGDRTNSDGSVDETIVGDAKPSESGAQVGGFVADSAATLITGYNSPVNFNDGGTVGTETGALQFQFNSIFTNEYTSIMFATSNTAPNYWPGETRDGTAHAEGDIATPNPEPADFVLILSAFPPIAFVCLRRRRERLALAA